MTSCLEGATRFLPRHVDPDENNFDRGWGRGGVVLRKSRAMGGNSWYVNSCSLAPYLTVAVTEDRQRRMVCRGVKSVGQDVQGNVSPMQECLARPQPSELYNECRI